MQIQLTFDTEHESPVFIKSIFGVLAEYNNTTLAGLKEREFPQPQQGFTLPTSQEIIQALAEPKKRGPRKVKNEPIPQSEAPANNIGQSPEPLPAPEKIIPIYAVRAAMHPKITAGKHEAVRKVLDAFNAEGATTVEPKDRAAFIEQINAIV